MNSSLRILNKEKSPLYASMKKKQRYLDRTSATNRNEKVVISSDFFLQSSPNTVPISSKTTVCVVQTSSECRRYEGLGPAQTNSNSRRNAITRRNLLLELKGALACRGQNVSGEEVVSEAGKNDGDEVAVSLSKEVYFPENRQDLVPSYLICDVSENQNEFKSPNGLRFSPGILRSRRAKTKKNLQPSMAICKELDDSDAEEKPKSKGFLCILGCLKNN